MFGPNLEITVHQLKTALTTQTPEPFRLIDCREPEEHALCQIEGNELIPLQTLAENANTHFPNPNETLLIYCHHGMRSAQAALFLRQKGHPKAYSIAGGIEAWSTEIDPATPRY